MVDSSFYKIKMCLCQVEVWIYLYSAHNMDPHVHIGSNERGKENTPHTRGKTQTNKQKQTANTGITKGWLGGSPPLHVHITIRIRRNPEGVLYVCKCMEPRQQNLKLVGPQNYCTQRVSVCGLLYVRRRARGSEGRFTRRVFGDGCCEDCRRADRPDPRRSRRRRMGG